MVSFQDESSTVRPSDCKSIWHPPKRRKGGASIAVFPFVMDHFMIEIVQALVFSTSLMSKPINNSGLLQSDERRKKVC